MTIVALRALVSHQPFVPFLMRMSSGQEYEVKHPENIAIGQATCIVFYPESDGWAQLDVKLVGKILPIEVRDEGE